MQTIKHIGENCSPRQILFGKSNKDGAIVADAVSKSDWCRLRRYMPYHTERPNKVPKALLDWIDKPCEDRMLGQKILTEMATKSLIVNYNC